MKQFSAPCNFNGQNAPFNFWIADTYKKGNHPLYFQSDWLSKTRGGTLDPKISDGILEIAKLSEKNKVSFEYLFGIAMAAALKKYAPNSGGLSDKSKSLSKDSDDSDESGSVIASLS